MRDAHSVNNGSMTLFGRSRDLAVAGYCAAFILPGEETLGEAAFGAHLRRTLDHVLGTGQGEPLLAAARLAQLQACELMLSCFETLGPALGVADAVLRDAATRQLAQACLDERASIDQTAVNGRLDAEADGVAVAASEAEAPDLFASRQSLRRHINGIALAGLDEHLSGSPAPLAFASLLEDLDGAGTGFFEAYILYLAWQIKTEDGLSKLLAAHLAPVLRESGVTADALLAGLYDACGGLSARFDAMLQAADEAAPARAALAARFPPLWWQRPREALCRDHAAALAHAGTMPACVFDGVIAAASAEDARPEELHARFEAAAWLYRGIVSSLNGLGNGAVLPPSAKTELLALLPAGRFVEAGQALCAQAEGAAQAGDHAAGETLMALSGHLFEIGGRASRALVCHVRALELAGASLSSPDGVRRYDEAVARIVRAFIRAQPQLGRDALKHAQSVVALMLPRCDKARQPVRWARLKCLQADISLANGAALVAAAAYEAAANQYASALAVEAAFTPEEREQLRAHQLLAIAARALLPPRRITALEHALRALDDFPAALGETPDTLAGAAAMARAALKASIAACRRESELLEQADAELKTFARSKAAKGEHFLALAAAVKRAEALADFAAQAPAADWYRRTIAAHEEVLQLSPLEDSAAVLLKMGGTYKAWADHDETGHGEALLERALACLSLADARAAGADVAGAVIPIRKARAATLLKLAKLRRDRATFEAACNTLKGALSMDGAAHDASLREGLAFDLAAALLAAGETLGDAALMEEAEQHFAALAQHAPQARPAFRVRALLGLGTARRRLGALHASVAMMRRALAAHDDALHLAKTLPQSDLLARAKQRREETAAALLRVEAGDANQPGR